MKTIHDGRYIALIELLRSKRIDMGLTHAEVASRLHVPRSWVGKVEQRERRLDVLDLWRLCQIYGMKLSELERVLAEDERP